VNDTVKTLQIFLKTRTGAVGSGVQLPSRDFPKMVYDLPRVLSDEHCGAEHFDKSA
jgi:hypothetical protein